MPDQNTPNEPIFNIQRVYLKDLSLEQPNSPQILTETNPPAVDVSLDITADPVAEGIFEVCLTTTVTAKIADRTLFLIEAKQAGIFEIRNIDDEQVQKIVGIACPTILFPYLRANVSDICTRASFPPVFLSEVNFQAMYEAQHPASASADRPH